MPSFKLDINKSNTNCLIKTSSPKLFLRLCNCNKVNDCGIYYKAQSSLSTIGMNDKPDETKVWTVDREEFVPYQYPKIAVEDYKRAIKVLAIEEVDMKKYEKGVWNLVKEDIIDFDLPTLGLFSALWICSSKSEAVTITYAIFTLLSQIDITEAYLLAKSMIMSEEKKVKGKDQLFNSQIAQVGFALSKKDDVMLYLRLDGNDIKLKKTLH